MGAVGNYEVVSQAQSCPAQGGFHSFTVEAPAGKLILSLVIQVPSGYETEQQNLPNYWYPNADGSAQVFLSGQGTISLDWTIHLITAEMGN